MPGHTWSMATQLNMANYPAFTFTKERKEEEEVFHSFSSPRGLWGLCFQDTQIPAGYLKTFTW